MGESYARYEITSMKGKISKLSPDLLKTMSNSASKVFLDQNLFADLAGRVPNAGQYLSKIKASIEKGKLIIVPSVELFDELIPLSQSDEHQFQARWRLIQELVDWSYALKPANDILIDDILNFAKYEKQDNPFAASELNAFSAIKTLAGMKEPPSTNELQNLTLQLHQFKGNFTSLINRIGKNCYGKTKYPKDFTFAQYWQETLNCSDYRKSFPQLMLSDLADKLAVGDICRTKGLVNLLSLPTILLPIGYWTYSWFCQVTKGSKEKSSVAFDFRHCTLAGAVGCFVTSDKDLTDSIKEIPGHNVTVFSMPELIHEL